MVNQEFPAQMVGGPLMRVDIAGPTYAIGGVVMEIPGVRAIEAIVGICAHDLTVRWFRGILDKGALRDNQFRLIGQYNNAGTIAEITALTDLTTITLTVYFIAAENQAAS